jgi:hypothetical protein
MPDFSTTLREAEWANTRLVAQDPVESVRAMKDVAPPAISSGLGERQNR